MQDPALSPVVPWMSLCALMVPVFQTTGSVMVLMIVILMKPTQNAMVLFSKVICTIHPYSLLLMEILS